MPSGRLPPRSISTVARNVAPLKPASVAFARRATVAGELSFGSMPLTASKIARSIARLISPALAWPAVVPSSSHPVEQLAPVIFAAPNGEFEVETLAVAFRRTLEQVFEADVAGVDLHHQLDQRAGRNDVETLRVVGGVKSKSIRCHELSPLLAAC